MKPTIREFDATRLAPPRNLSEITWPEALRDSPLDLEIGCGVGWHPITYARREPTRRLIAIEHTRAKFQSFERRLKQNAPLENLIAVHADAVRWIAHALAPESIDRVFILYPNPEPHAPNKRWLRMPFFHRLIKTMKSGAILNLATNDRAYYEEALQYAREVWQLAIVEDQRRTEEPRTHFEKKYLARGETCFDVTFAKP